MSIRSSWLDEESPSNTRHTATVVRNMLAGMEGKRMGRGELAGRRGGEGEERVVRLFCVSFFSVRGFALPPFCVG